MMHKRSRKRLLKYTSKRSVSFFCCSRSTDVNMTFNNNKIGTSKRTGKNRKKENNRKTRNHLLHVPYDLRLKVSVYYNSQLELPSSNSYTKNNISRMGCV